MPPQSYNFFGMGPGQMAPSQNPALLAQQMQLQEYNNPTSQNAQSSQGGGMGGIDPKSIAKMLMSQNGDTGVPMDAQAQGIPANAQSYNLGAGPLPWLPQNALPWSGS